MSFEHCVRCTVCVENCPVFKVEPLFPGPKQAGPDAQRFRLDGEKSVDQWVRLCSQCKRCEVSCPNDVEVSEIILNAQLKYSREHLSPFSSHLFANTYYISGLGSLAAPVFNRVSSWGISKGVMSLLGIATSLPFPSFRFLTLQRGWKRRGRGARKVVFFHGCFLNFNRPDIGRGIRDLLASLGVQVIIPKQSCCGLPALGNGDLDMARKYAQQNAATLARYIDKGHDVVYACTSCGLTLVRDYPGVLDITLGEKISENTYNVHEYLLSLIENGYTELAPAQVNMTIAYHIPCHLRALGIGYPAARILERIPGLTCHLMEDNCCGLSGSYGFKKKNQGISRKLGQLASSAIREREVEAIVSDCGACRMQLSHYTGLPAFDPSELIVESMKKP
ncbi:MAG TPA: anaerobic glycerol-3-phosphate dehydrogenase subunit C [Deltaproteobacteria bacterium]|nr:anaerobic glycerol-3-phosphate dehydrogenase subunit C [Deltaproteobacteria bacterium]